MKKNLRLIFAITLIGLSIFSGCNKDRLLQNTKIFPPESSRVLENGSVPPGFNEAMKRSGIDRDCINCNSQNRYGKSLRPYSKKSAADLIKKLFPHFVKLDSLKKNSIEDILEDHIMWAMVRAVLIDSDNNNFGAIVLKGRYWTDAAGRKHLLTIFRSAFTPSPDDPGSCYYSLLECGNVRHVINLYDGEMDVSGLVMAEKRTAEKFGATYLKASDHGYGGWRDKVRKNPDPGSQRDAAKRMVISLIKEQILRPGGKSPRGNILIHCGGGMHRTGMIIGILQRAINNISMEDIRKEYTYHVGYRGSDRPGGFEEENLDFIKIFSASDFK